MTTNQIELARHALGLNKNQISFRNHFVTGPGSSDYADWIAMVEQGNARHRAGSAISGGDPIFWLTKQGAERALRPGEALDAEAFPATEGAA